MLNCRSINLQTIPIYIPIDLLLISCLDYRAQQPFNNVFQMCGYKESFLYVNVETVKHVTPINFALFVLVSYLKTFSLCTFPFSCILPIGRHFSFPFFDSGSVTLLTEFFRKISS